MSIVENLRGIIIVDTLETATALVEQAPWDEYGSTLSGNEIWGAYGQFAGRHAASNFSYQSAIAACSAFFGDAE